MMMRGGGWFRYMHGHGNAKPNVTRRLLLRVLAYAKPYRRQNRLDSTCNGSPSS